METAQQIENRAYARCMFGNCDDGSLLPDDAIWDEERLQVADFVDLMDGGMEGWREWLAGEFQNLRLDGMVSHWEAYLEVADLAAHLRATADGPPVVAIGDDGKFVIWDGWHRIAAHVARGERHVEVLLGRRIGSGLDLMTPSPN
ncbi:hypothetical protein G6L37_01545 [Agrobacterium rubi]|nr:hypothetical protein [Agrobacterium rubi]NTF24077.1 hypothetical protein [Agrobacterium rubi]